MEEKRRLRSLENIISMGEKLLTTFDVTELLDALVESVTSLLNVQGATLYLVDSYENRLFSQSIHSNGIKEISLPIDNSSIAGHTATTRKSLHIKDAYADLSFIHPEIKFNRKVDEQSGQRTRNIITHPLLINNELIGVFQVINKSGGDFDGGDQVVLKNFSLVAAIAIMNARLMERVMEAQASSYNVMENASDMVIIQNNRGMILHLNRSACEYLRSRGKTGDVTGMLFSETFPELSSFALEINKVVEGHLDRAVSHGNPSYVILTEKNINHQIEKVILMIRNSGCVTEKTPSSPEN